VPDIPELLGVVVFVELPPFGILPPLLVGVCAPMPLLLFIEPLFIEEPLLLIEPLLLMELPLLIEFPLLMDEPEFIDEPDALPGLVICC